MSRGVAGHQEDKDINFSRAKAFRGCHLLEICALVVPHGLILGGQNSIGGAGRAVAKAAELFGPEPACPRCGSSPWRDGREPSGLRGWRCRSCGARFTSLTGAVFEGSRAGLPTWARFTSEGSSGERRSRGGITKAGNKHLRRLLVEAAWHFANASRRAKPPARGQLVDPAVRRRALKGNRRLVDRRRALDDAGPAVATGCTARRRHGRILNSETSVEQTRDSAGGTLGDDI